MLSSLLICKIKTSLKAKHNSKHKCESVGSYYPHPQTGVREKDRQSDKEDIRGCLVSVSKQRFSVFKQHFTYFYKKF